MNLIRKYWTWLHNGDEVAGRRAQKEVEEFLKERENLDCRYPYPGYLCAIGINDLVDEDEIKTLVDKYGIKRSDFESEMQDVLKRASKEPNPKIYIVDSLPNIDNSDE